MKEITQQKCLDFINRILGEVSNEELLVFD